MLSTCSRTPLARGFLQVACYATKPEQDYSLTMKSASEIATAEYVAPGEVGMSYGIPLETFKRKVGQPVETEASQAWSRRNYSCSN
jgi:hypothetical protein